MRARRTDAPRKTAITMTVMAPGPSTPEHTKRGCGLTSQPRNLISELGYSLNLLRRWPGRGCCPCSQRWRAAPSCPGTGLWWWCHLEVLQIWYPGCPWILSPSLQTEYYLTVTTEPNSAPISERFSTFSSAGWVWCFLWGGRAVYTSSSGRTSTALLCLPA